MNRVLPGSLLPSKHRTGQLRIVPLIVAALFGICVSAGRASADEIRTGILAFEEQKRHIVADDRFFSDLHRVLPDGAPFQLAVGTHREIVSWAERDLIELAVVTPLVFAQLANQGTDNPHTEWSYLATERPTSPPTGSRTKRIIIASSKLAEREAIRQALLERFPDRFLFENSWEQELAAEKRNFSSSGFVKYLQARETVTFEEAGKMLLLHRCTQVKPLRLAVVFAGGGAKCSYQVGAVNAVEEALSNLRERYHDPSLDISLAVGTSGGALNAVPVALGISGSAKSRPEFESVWTQLDQREIIRPSMLVRVLMVLWFVCLQGIVLIRVRRERHFRNPEKYPWIISPFFIAFGIFQVVLARLPMKPWSLLGTSSLVHHFWLWLSWGLEGSGWTLIAVGLLSRIMRKIPAVADAPFPVRFRVVRRIGWIGILFIPVVQAVNILWYQPTLSDSAGIEGAIVKNFSTLVNRHLENEGQPKLSIDPQETTRNVLSRMGREIIDRSLLRRDLVLTGSALPENTSEAAGDLYFYAPGRDEREAPRFGPRGVSLRKRPETFMDVLIGSGAIYPVFPARTITDFPVPGSSVDVVDGSFAHRSPVEAAVQWGATHILLIQAATDEVTARGALLDNLMASMNHLYDEAQLLDFRSREQAVTLTLTPKPPHIGLLDFSDNLIQTSIAKGYREAKGKLDRAQNTQPTYRKELGEPAFWTVPMPNPEGEECRDLSL